ncbi:BamA/OMP85 family outer membrane protein [Dialister micraerophilus]|uniref:Outer membrane protein, OMP85 family n=1 Tax=Dialister micraerophilus UPII 345-E TaxID=910314 RepID=E4L8J3_9FIRM|nr:BamA/TamA family outer membrane protein [Dialister micraerophilus]EFR42915.1 outer membrane protein, OMP85 family [Dialister micraerophilus UPII 345-E]
MISISKKKTLLATAVLLSLGGMSVYAQVPSINENTMSQSTLLNVSNGGGNKSSASQVFEKQMAENETIQGSQLYLSDDSKKEVNKHTGELITSVEFTGIEETAKAEIESELKSKVGTKVSAENIDADVETVSKIGTFSQIIPDFTNVPEGVKLNYRLVSNPVVKSVEFEGNSVFTDAQLNSVMQVQPGSVLNVAQVNRKIKEIEDIYLKQGFLLVNISDVYINAEGKLRIKINEGNVEKITIVGNEKTKDNVIKRELRFMEGQPFNKFLANRSIERLYNLGFFEDVNMRLLPGTTEHTVTVEIGVVEQKTGVITVGAGYSKSDGFVGVVEVGETNFRGTGDKVNFHWEFGGSGKGKNYQVSYTKPWINKNGDSAGFSIYNRLYKYVDYNAKGQGVAQYDKRRKGWNITWGRVSDEYRTNYLNIESSSDRIQGDVQHLSGLVEAYEKELKPAFVKEWDRVEKPKWERSWAAGDTLPEAERNKQWKDWSASWDKGAKGESTDNQAWNKWYAEWLKNNAEPKDVEKNDPDYATKHSEYETKHNEWKTKRKTDADAAKPTEKDNAKDGQRKVAKENAISVDADKYYSKSKEAIRKSTGRTNSITFTHVYDSRDNFFNATKGKRISVSAQWGGHGLGGDFDFYKVSGEGRFYKGLRNGNTLALRVMGGYIHGNIAYGNLFSLGGSNTLRGYEDEQFKGKKMYAATLEYRFPIAKKIQGVVFTDVGSAWDVGGSMPWYVDSRSINYAYGVGVRLQTPIGPIRLDYGHGDQNKFHFSFGTQF